MSYCSNFKKIDKIDSEPDTERKLFERYADDIICTQSDDPDSLRKGQQPLQEIQIRNGEDRKKII